MTNGHGGGSASASSAFASAGSGLPPDPEPPLIMAVPTPEQRRGGGLLPGLRISGTLGREAATTAAISPKKPSKEIRLN